jgi:hypothetical protein
MIMFLSGLSVLFALSAAALWAWSSLVNLPIIGSAYGSIANLDPLLRRIEESRSFKCVRSGLRFSIRIPSSFRSLSNALMDCA